MELQFTIRPGIPPSDRGLLEDRVLSALGARAELVGGGGMIDGSMSDFQIQAYGLSADDAVALCRDVFATISFSLPTRVEVEVEDRVVTLPTAVAEV